MLAQLKPQISLYPRHIFDIRSTLKIKFILNITLLVFCQLANGSTRFGVKEHRLFFISQTFSIVNSNISSKVVILLYYVNMYKDVMTSRYY